MTVSDLIAEAGKSVTALGALITALAGFLMLARSLLKRKSTGRADVVGTPPDVDELAALREQNVKDARALYELRRQLAAQGIDV